MSANEARPEPISPAAKCAYCWQPLVADAVRSTLVCGDLNCPLWDHPTPPEPAPAGDPAFDLDTEMNALVNATRDGNDDEAEIAQDAIYAEFARLAAVETAYAAVVRERDEMKRKRDFYQAGWITSECQIDELRATVATLEARLARKEDERSTYYQAGCVLARESNAEAIRVIVLTAERDAILSDYAKLVDVHNAGLAYREGVEGLPADTLTRWSPEPPSRAALAPPGGANGQ